MIGHTDTEEPGYAALKEDGMVNGEQKWLLKVGAMAFAGSLAMLGTAGMVVNNRQLQYVAPTGLCDAGEITDGLAEGRNLHGRGYRYSVANERSVFQDVIDFGKPGSVQTSTWFNHDRHHLGSFSHTNGNIAHFINGDRCGLKGPRSSTVEYSCGSDDVMTWGEETSTCRYHFKVQTPQCCAPATTTAATTTVAATGRLDWDMHVAPFPGEKCPSGELGSAWIPGDLATVVATCRAHCDADWRCSVIHYTPEFNSGGKHLCQWFRPDECINPVKDGNANLFVREEGFFLRLPHSSGCRPSPNNGC